jgi:hypothetical protein
MSVSRITPLAVVDRGARLQNVGPATLHVVLRADADGLDRALRADHVLHGGDELLRQTPVCDNHEPDHA